MSRFIPINLVRVAHENSTACSSCGGVCCKGLPGEILPSDLGEGLNAVELYTRMREMLMSGQYAVDWWENYHPADEDEATRTYGACGYYLRPAIQGQEGRWFDGSYGGACVFHSDEAGCALEAHQRPHSCLTLVPSVDEQGRPNCDHADGWEGKLGAAKAWWPYRHLFESLKHDPRRDEVTLVSGQAA